MVLTTNFSYKSASTFAVQIMYTIFILAITASLSESMPHARSSVTKYSSDPGCGNKCFMSYHSCRTIAINFSEHTICLTARKLCAKECKLGLL